MNPMILLVVTLALFVPAYCEGDGGDEQVNYHFLELNDRFYNISVN